MSRCGFVPNLEPRLILTRRPRGQLGLRAAWVHRYARTSTHARSRALETSRSDSSSPSQEMWGLMPARSDDRWIRCALAC